MDQLVAKFRLQNGAKMFLPVFGDRFGRVGFPTREKALEHRTALIVRYMKLRAAQELVRQKSVRFRLFAWLANFFNSLTLRAKTRAERWHPK